VFKLSKFYVFYGNSVDGTGNPVFNYRAVKTGVGHGQTTWGSGNQPAGSVVATSARGVYFLNPDGVWLTTGGAPVKVSGALDPWFRGTATPMFAGPSLTSSLAGKRLGGSASMTVFRDRLVVSIGTTVLVYSETTGQWMMWSVAGGSASLAMGVAAAPRTSVDDRLLIAYTGSAATSTAISYLDSAASSDLGVAFTSRYRSAFQSFDWRGRNLRSGIHNVEKIVRESMVDGSGTVGYTLSNQWTQPASLPASRTLTLGTAPQVKQARDRTAVKGREFSYQLSGTAPWSVEKVTLALHGYEEAGLKETGN